MVSQHSNDRLPSVETRVVVTGERSSDEKYKCDLLLPGAAESGKSSLVGSLTSGMLDDGRCVFDRREFCNLFILVVFLVFVYFDIVMKLLTDELQALRYRQSAMTMRVEILIFYVCYFLFFRMCIDNFNSRLYRSSVHSI